MVNSTRGRASLLLDRSPGLYNGAAYIKAEVTLVPVQDTHLRMRVTAVCSTIITATTTATTTSVGCIISFVSCRFIQD